MQSRYISQPLLPPPRPAAGARSVASSHEGATAPLSITKARYPGIDGVMQAATELVAKYTGDERIRRHALSITRSVRRHPATGQPDLRDVDQIAGAIYTWMVRNINYVRDPWDVERIQSPDVTLRQKAGDCDDHAILGAALLQSLGIHTGLRIVSRTGTNFDHIYAVYRSPEGWKSFDTTVLKYPGYRFDERLIKKSRHIPNRMPDDLGFDPITAAAAIASTVSTGMSAKNTLSHLFAAGDKDEREFRSTLRGYLMSRGVRSEVISYSHQDNHILQRYAQLIDELGKPAVDHLNRAGNLPDSVATTLRTNRTRTIGRVWSDPRRRRSANGRYTMAHYIQHTMTRSSYITPGGDLILGNDTTNANHPSGGGLGSWEDTDPCRYSNQSCRGKMFGALKSCRRRREKSQALCQAHQKQLEQKAEWETQREQMMSALQTTVTSTAQKQQTATSAMKTGLTIGGVTLAGAAILFALKRKRNQNHLHRRPSHDKRYQRIRKF